MRQFTKSILKWTRRSFIVVLAVTSVVGLQRLYERSVIGFGIKQILGVASPGEFTTYVLGSQKIKELATLQMPLLVQGFSNKGVWPVDSTMTIQGMYSAKIGFDLSKRFQLDVDAISKRIHVILPVPIVLSVERQDLTVLGHDQSFLTSMTPDELAKFYSAMDRHAKSSIASNDTALSGAVDNLKADMTRFSSMYGYTISLNVDHDVEYRNDKSIQGTVVKGSQQSGPLVDLND